MRPALSFAGTAAALATAAACDVVTTGRPALLWMVLVAAGAVAAGAWTVAAAVAARLQRTMPQAPGGRFVLLAVAAAFALADAYAGASGTPGRPFLLPTLVLLACAGALSGIANCAALSRSLSEDPSR
ncbi:hypothetical protein [Caenispirillum bisanense]|uniref:Uncharacterized protein n=1 Tax=Caenispirillum bisanense TaxID=414052 RepID=A0A286GU25_9PROT|nr:hypothetical protein [Caenispirillum bisanense]SOD98589.1 hypothetical protein SAMN05421508_10818 [Caenispirillum bisanense]